MRNKLRLLNVPYVIWMALFTVAPIIMVVLYAFSTGDGGFTMEHFSDMGTYTVVFGRSFKLALIATAVCVLIGYPVSYFMAKEGPGFQRTGPKHTRISLQCGWKSARLCVRGGR